MVLDCERLCGANCGGVTALPDCGDGVWAVETEDGCSALGEVATGGGGGGCASVAGTAVGLG